MIHIDKLDPDVQFALKEHYRFTKCLIGKRIGKTSVCSDPKCPVCFSKLQAVENIPLKIQDLLSEEDFIESIILGEPHDLQFSNEIFLRNIMGDFAYENAINSSGILRNPKSKEDHFYYLNYINILKIITKIFDYEGWFVSNEPSNYYSAYHLATYLNIRSCVYCNRTYTVSQFKIAKGGIIEKLIRPQFDHWFPKENYPLLALSFFNLIPSCSICNSSVKGRKEFSLSEYIHPYEDKIIDSVIFTYEYLHSIDTVKIRVVGVNSDSNLETRIQNTLVDFHIEEMYNSHHSELKDLLKIKQTYSENYLKSLKDNFPKAGLTDKEIYRLVFGVELNASDFHKRPFSKFKNDILKELKII